MLIYYLKAKIIANSIRKRIKAMYNAMRIRMKWSFMSNYMSFYVLLLNNFGEYLLRYLQHTSTICLLSCACDSLNLARLSTTEHLKSKNACGYR